MRFPLNDRPLDCDAARPLLDLLAGDDLDGRERLVVEAHLRGCLACFREFTAMRALLGTVRDVAARELRSEATGEAIVAGVMGAIHGPPPAAPRLLPRLVQLGGWASAAALAIAVGLNSVRAPQAPPSGGARPVIVEGGSGGSLPIHAVGNEVRRRAFERALEPQFEQLHQGGDDAAGRKRGAAGAARPGGGRRNM
jgi:anti-sigma factor RsiW